MGAVYTQLSITERRKIERWRHAKVPVNEMAKVLKRCRSTIFRELKRNHFSDESMPKHDGYYGAAAQLMMADRRARDRKLIKYPELCERVLALIKDGCPIKPADRSPLTVVQSSWTGRTFRQRLGRRRGSAIRRRPGQKGTVENTNRRARRWLPRKRDIRLMTDNEIKQISDRLNNTPRKCLGWKTPAEVFREKMLEEMR